MSILKSYASAEYRQHFNTAIRAELENAGIPVLELPASLGTEVKTRYIGLLNGFVFTRGWRYWVCVGDMPLADAKEIYRLYRHLVVRADGHAGNPDPVTCCYSPIQEAREQAIVEAMKAKGATTEEMVAELEKLEVDATWPKFVRMYHIDTTEGLAAIAAYIKEHNIYAYNGEPGSYTASVFPGGGDCA